MSLSPTSRLGKGLRKATRLGRSVRHVPLRQLLARAGYLGKRRVAVALTAKGWLRRDGMAPAAPPLAPDPPRPLFPPREEALRHLDGIPHAVLLTQPYPLTPPMDWEPMDFEVDPRLARLSLHYMEYLEAADDELLIRLVDDWIRSNPPFRPVYWLTGWNSYGLSIRCVVWMQQLALRGDRLPVAFRERMARSLTVQLRFLAANLEIDVRGNHILKNIKALLWAGRFFTGPEAERWTRTGESHLRRELQEQVLDDGVHFERSPAYHAQVFADLLECLQVLRPGELHDQLHDALRGMAQALANLTHPDGMCSLFNDGGLHMAYAPGVCLGVYEQLTGESVRAERVFAHATAGYFGAREADRLILVDCGPVGPDPLMAHAHGDILALEWSVRGHRVIVDTGVFEYLEGEPRSYSRSTRAHNTVTVDDQDQCEFWSSFRVARRARVRLESYRSENGGFVLHGSHDGFAGLEGAPVHHRRYLAVPDRIEVEDEVRGGAGQVTVARLLLHPGCRAVLVPGGCRIQVGDEVLATLRTEYPLRLDEAPWYPDFGVSEETRQIVIDYGRAPCHGSFVLENATTGSTHV